MEFHLNDFIKSIREDSVFVGKLFQIIEFQEKRDFGKPARLVKIRNVETKADQKIDENMLFQHFEKIDFKSVPIDTADTEWKLDELRDRNEESKPELEPKEESKSEIKIPEDAKEQIALIRKLIKEKCPTVSVRCGKGTAWGWVDIWGSADEFNSFSEAERKALTNLGLNCGGNCSNISPQDRKYYINKWLSSKQ